jgi:hypothetical protein
VKGNDNMRKDFITGIGVAVLLIACGSSAFAAVVDFSHIDDNPYSPRSGQSVGPYDGINGGTVTMWYHQYNEY